MPYFILQETDFEIRHIIACSHPHPENVVIAINSINK